MSFLRFGFHAWTKVFINGLKMDMPGIYGCVKEAMSMCKLYSYHFMYPVSHTICHVTCGG